MCIIIRCSKSKIQPTNVHQRIVAVVSTSCTSYSTTTTNLTKFYLKNYSKWNQVPLLVQDIIITVICQLEAQSIRRIACLVDILQVAMRMTRNFVTRWSMTKMLMGGRQQMFRQERSQVNKTWSTFMITVKSLHLMLVHQVITIMMVLMLSLVMMEIEIISRIIKYNDRLQNCQKKSLLKKLNNWTWSMTQTGKFSVVMNEWLPLISHLRKVSKLIKKGEPGGSIDVK